MKHKFLLTMAIALLLTACGKDDDGDGGGAENNTRTPITFTANIQPEKTRVTVNNGWTGLSDNRVAIKIDGTTKTYTVSEIGEVTSNDPFYWDERESVTVEAWYPFCDGVKPETITVYADQSIPENYEKSDFLEVVGAGASRSAVTAKRNTLTFTHRTAKMSCNISSIYGNAKGAQVTFHGLTGVDVGTSVKATSKHRALIVPQTIPAGTEFMEVVFSDGSRYIHTLKEELDLGKAYQVQADVTIDETGIDAVYSQLTSWIVDEETPDGKSPGTNPGNNGEGWKGDGNDENTNGSSPGTDPNGSNGGWTGGSEDTNGSSSEANPNNGNNGSWTGIGEDANGTTPEANPNNGNGSWSESREDINGNSPDANPDNGNGSWTKNDENTNADDSVPTDWGWTTP